MFVEGLIYHVYNRAGRGEAPFKLEDEADRFWSLLHEVEKWERNERLFVGRLEQPPWWAGEPAVEKSGHGVDALGRGAGAVRQRYSAGEFLARVEPPLGWRSGKWRARSGARLCWWRGSWWRHWRSSVGALGARRSPAHWARAATG